MPSSPLLTALSMAELHRDFKGNDDAVAAKILDTAIRRFKPTDSAVDQGRALLARAELAIARDEHDLLQELTIKVESLALTETERAEATRTRRELDSLRAWIDGGATSPR